MGWSDKASKSAERGDFGSTLATLLDAWRETPARELATAIEAVGAHTQRAVPPLAGATAAAKHKAWLAAAKSGDPVVRGMLIATVSETRGTAETLARIEVLAKTKDPRFAARLAEIVERPIYNAMMPRTTAFWKRIFVLLAGAGDPRVLERARTFPDAWKRNRELTADEREIFPKRFARDCMPLLEKAFRAGVPALGKADAAACAKIAELAARADAEPAGRVDEAALLANVYANPDDDAPRMVLADWLQDRGDPRGELIALQLANRSGRMSPRERELVGMYGPQMLGTLVKKVKKTGIKLERGFLARCTPSRDLDRDPAWATVRELDGAVPGPYARVPALRRLVNIPIEKLPQLAELRGCSIEELALLRSSGMYDGLSSLGHRLGLGLLDDAPAFAKLRMLSIDGWVQMNVDPKGLDWMADSPLVQRLHELEFQLSLRQLPIALRVLAGTKLERLVVWGNTDENDRASVGCKYGWCTIFERDATGALSRVTLRAPRLRPPRDPDRYGAEPAQGFAMLAASTLTSVQIVMHASAPAEARAAFKERVEAALERQGAELTWSRLT